MKNIFLIIVLTVMISITARGQNEARTREPYISRQGRTQILYGELLGNGMGISINYDRRFTRSDKGLGMRIGVGYLPVFFDQMLTLPFTLNHVSGKAPHYVEISLGLTCVTSTAKEWSSSWIPEFVSGVGYRYQNQSGFFTKFTVSLLNNWKEGGAMLWGGFAIGGKI